MRLPEPRFEFRAAVSGDEPSIRRVVFSVLAEYGLRSNPEVTDADLWDIDAAYAKRGGVFLVVVSRSDGVVGCGGLYPLTADECEIRKMYLLPLARGRGIGSALLNRLLAIAGERAFRRVIVETASVLQEAIALYRRKGFVPFEYEHLADRCDQAFVLQLPRRVPS